MRYDSLSSVCLEIGVFWVLRLGSFAWLDTSRLFERYLLSLSLVFEGFFGLLLGSCCFFGQTPPVGVRSLKRERF